jgi:dihydrolipoamide dehydrogenase
MDKHYDLAVLGGGPGGYTAAIRAARKGLTVALVERSELGGTCLNRGCVPTKALLHTTDLYRELSKAEEIGLRIEGLSYDLSKLYARKDAVVGQLRSGVEQLLKANKVDVICGSGRIDEAGKLRVTTDEQQDAPVEARHILLATGARPAMPPIEGIDLPGVISSDELLAAPPENCRRLVIIGGGVIGVEFASAFSSLGIEVTIIEALERLLPTLDREIGQNLAMQLKRRGVTVATGAMVERMTREDGTLYCHYTAKGKAETVACDLILVATGRRSDADRFIDAGSGIRTERGGVVVNEHYQTTVPHIYAVGDLVHGGIQLAHVAAAQGVHAVGHMIGEDAGIDLDTVPACIYTDPEIAVVGMTDEQAKAAGIETVSGKYIMSGNGRTLIAQQDRGFIKILAEAGTERIIGAQLMCARATDLVNELAVAIANRLSVVDLARTIRPHPTFGEGITESL